jgi:predicted hotdog family 3-hydroxylacyl-ACP dehydratase
MRLVDEVVEVSTRRVTCRSTIREDHVFRRDDGRVPSLIALELFAQAAAVLMIHRAMLVAGSAEETLGHARGILVGARDVSFVVDALDVGDVLLTHLEERYAAGHVAQLAGTVERDGIVVASGAINVARGPTVQSE